MTIIKPVLIGVMVISLLAVIMSSYWLKFNEFNELEFPLIKKISSRVLLMSIGSLMVVNIVSNLHFKKEIEEQKKCFIDAYSEYVRFSMNPIKLENDISKQIDLLLKSGSPRGRYRAAILKADDQLSMTLYKLRAKDKSELERIFGTSDVSVHDVFARRDLINLSDSDVKQAVNSGVYLVELYYTDVDKRAEAEETYRNRIAENYSYMSEQEQESLLSSYMTQYDTDRSFDVSKEIKFTLSDKNEVILDDEAKQFIVDDTPKVVLDPNGNPVGAE